MRVRIRNLIGVAGAGLLALSVSTATLTAADGDGAADPTSASPEVVAMRQAAQDATLSDVSLTSKRSADDRGSRSGRKASSATSPAPTTTEPLAETTSPTPTATAPTGTTGTTSPTATTTAPTETTGTTPLATGDTTQTVSGSWATAWASGDAEVLRAWFAANTGPSRAVSGTTSGGQIRTQADADRLAGMTVTSALSVSCTCVLQDFALVNAPLTIDGGQVTVRNATLDGRGNTELVGLLTARGTSQVTLSHVEITGHQDGVRAYAQSVTGDHLYIHDVARDNPRDHHQDGIQTIGGRTAFTESFVDMTGASTSTTLIKPDAAPIPEARINRTVMIGGGYTFHVHDGPHGTPGRVDLSDNLVAPGYSVGLMSTWQLTNPGQVIPATSVRVSVTGRLIPLVDGARI